jgi:shikimate dehydrogenase
MRIVLCGFRGTGKTETGRRLAHLLDLPFIDTDQLIEETAGITIHDMMQAKGEAYFREQERNAIASLGPEDAVISTGGGAVVDPVNVEILRRGSFMVLLETDEKEIQERIERSTRPPLTTLPLREEIRMLLSVREPFYTAASDICINTHGKQVNEIAQAIIHLLSAGDSPLASREYAVGFLKASGMEEAEWKNAQEVLIGDAYFPARRFYAVAGNPCMHSKSPPLFNSLFRQFGIPAFYTRFEHPDCGVIMQLARDLHMKGLSVTIPHKTSIMPFVDRIDGHSRKIGAVNTVVFCKDRAYGYNTDWTGIRDPVSDLHLDAARAVVIGAGGAAAAAVYALLDLQMEVIILSRTPGKGAELARRLGASHSPLTALESLAPDLVVNATPVGMSPDWRSPVPREVLKEGMTVFDLVYTPPETTLIRDARAAGCRTITGTEMFIRQACAQFRHFTGIEVPVGRIRELV